MSNPTRLIAAAILGVVLGLLAVGVVSGTIVRHAIQVLPALLALALLMRRVPWANYAALPVFVVWLLIMTAIWFYLSGLARIVSGTFSPAEVALTIVIGASCLVGLSQVFRGQPPARAGVRVAAVVVFGALQVGALWLSLQPAFARI